MTEQVATRRRLWRVKETVQYQDQPNLSEVCDRRVNRKKGGRRVGERGHRAEGMPANDDEQ